VDHDYEGCGGRELKERGEPTYPPLVRLANVVVSSPDENRAALVAEQGAEWLRGWIRREVSRVEVVGPAPAPIERLHGRWRWHFLFRAPSSSDLGAAARALMAGDVDAAFFVVSPQSALVQRLLRADDVRLLTFRRAAAYQRKHPFLSSVTLHE